MDERVKELMERIRGVADMAADTANHTARVASRRAGQMVDSAKLNVQLFDLNGDFAETMRQLGQLVYDTHLGKAQVGDPVTELLAQADEQAEQIAQVKNRIADLRQSKNCPSCGAVCGKEDKFCRSCGAVL